VRSPELQARKIPLYKIYSDEDDVEAVASVIREGAFWAIGQRIDDFEKLLAETVGTKYAVTFNSGTSALHALMIASGIGPGDEIIVPSFTFIATANCALYVGAKPVFGEIEETTYGLDPQDVTRRISPKTKAIIPIHYGGLPCQIKELSRIAHESHLLLLEDAAESIGANINGKNVGTYGDASMISFCGNKVITTGEGGVILTDSRELLEKMLLIRSHGRLEKGNYFTSIETPDYITLGFNWRISTITAALGITQLRKLEKLAEMRRRNATYMAQRLKEINGVRPPSEPKGYFHIYQMFTIQLNGDSKVRDGLRDYLAKNGITSKVYFPPVHLTQFYRTKFGYREGALPITEEISNHVLTLPMYPTLTEAEMDYIADKIAKYLRTK
jgi:perosamine synthetase